MIYPFSKELQGAATNFSNGNFGLWFYKLVPLDDRNNFKPGTPRAGEKNVVSFYGEKYDLLKKSGELKNLLEKRHKDQEKFCRMHEQNGAKVITVRAKLQSPLITGIGKTHPNEVGMTFDHTMGIPYLPATGIKGLVRLAHILNLIEDTDKANALIDEDKNELDDLDPASLIPNIFGGDMKNGREIGKRRGSVVFLDAYPDKIPDLHLDIMNPHYGEYYGDDLGKIPPADYLDPVPVQFLTVQRGTTFVFRMIISGENESLREPVIKALQKALLDQGFGAKTAVGYGRFMMQGPTTKEELAKKGQYATEAKTIPERKTWEAATLTYSPNNQQVTAKSEFGNATVIGKDLVPEKYHKRLFDKKKSVGPVRVLVEPVGRNWRIIEIE